MENEHHQNSEKPFDERVKVIEKFDSYSSDVNTSLLHCDLHDGNTLKRGNEIIIYDKSSEIFAGHYLYDLAIVVGMYPNGAYVETKDPDHQNDREMLNSFMEGYGENFLQDHKDALDTYMVLRALERYPNPFVPESREIIENILKSSY